MNKSNYILCPKLLSQGKSVNDYTKHLLIAMDEDSSVCNYVHHLYKSLRMIGAVKKQKEMCKRLVGEDEHRCIEAIAELTYLSLWKYCNWDFKFEPNIGSKTPDFKVFTDKTSCFIAEVTTIHSNHPHLETISSCVNGKIIFKDKNTGKILKKLPPATQTIEQHNKIIYEIDQKYKKYRPIIENKLPFVICFFLPNYKSEFYINDFQIKTALFGEHMIIINKNNIEKTEYEQYPSKQKGQYDNEIYTGIFCFERYSDLTAILFINIEGYYNDKYSICLKIYLNPYGIWHNVSCNPFTKKGLSVSYVDKSDYIQFGEPNIINILYS